MYSIVMDKDEKIKEMEEHISNLETELQATKEHLKKYTAPASSKGGNASVVDYHLLHSGCKPNSKALKLATKTCRKKGKCKKYTVKKHSKK